MKRLVLLACLCSSIALSAQTIDYKGTKVTLGPKSLLVDGSLSDAKAAESPFIFNDFKAAIAACVDGTRSEPMRVYIAPWVYWVDDPDDPELRRPTRSGAPIGMYIECEALQLLGLSGDAGDVVLASARGQSQGAIGNFTMFDITGDDFVVRDMTWGNYCNIDLVYPKNPALNRAKRGPAITQAQVSFLHGDRAIAENVRFVARLNLCPLSGAKRVLFKDCHFETTDDSMNGTGVYLNCDLHTWGRLPFGGADRYGAIFLDSDIYVRHDVAVQALSKGVGRFSLVDVRYHAGRPVHLAWTLRPEEWLRCYQYGVTLDGQPAFVGAQKPYSTIALDDKLQLGAYRLVDEDGNVLYNTYNLLRGEDDWDPQGIKAKVEALSKRDGRDYANVATCLDMNVRAASLQTGGAELILRAALMRHVGYKLSNQTIFWRVQRGYEKYVALSATRGEEISIKATNHEDRTQVFNLYAYTEDGMEVAVQLTVAPDFLPAPEFVKTPVVKIEGGVATVEYELDLQGRRDESEITWYRCDKRNAESAVAVAVSRFGEPKTSYELTAADAGKFIMAGVAPKHLRCNAGPEVKAMAKAAVKRNQVPDAKHLETDFVDFPCGNQTAVKPGYWSVDAFKPADTKDYTWAPDLEHDCWLYGTGINGAKGYGIQPIQQGARLRYTPLAGKYGDMSITWAIDPAKDGGQGFASARQQYLDLFVKFDTKTLTGYALRVIRTTKYANAVDILLVRYDAGEVTPVSEPKSVDCFLTGCVLSVKYEAGVLSASVEGPGRIAELASDPNIHHGASLSAKVQPNDFGGFGLQHTSTVGSESRILVHSVKVDWK